MTILKIFIKFLLLLIIQSTLFAQAPGIDWFRAQGTDTEEHVHEGMQTSDGGYIAIGHGIESSGEDDMLIIKINVVAVGIQQGHAALLYQPVEFSLPNINVLVLHNHIQ